MNTAALAAKRGCRLPLVTVPYPNVTNTVESRTVNIREDATAAREQVGVYIVETDDICRVSRSQNAPIMELDGVGMFQKLLHDSSRLRAGVIEAGEDLVQASVVGHFSFLVGIEWRE